VPRGTVSLQLGVVADRKLHDRAEDHVDLDAVLRQRHYHTLHHRPAPVLARVHRAALAVGRPVLLDGRDVLVPERAGEAGMDLVEIGARQIAAHQHAIGGSDEPIAEAQRLSRDIDDEHVGKKRADRGRIDMLPSRQHVWRSDQEPVLVKLPGCELAGLSLGLKSLEAAVVTDGGRNTLRWLQSLTAQLGGNLHRTAWELRPTSLDDVGLARALETYVADWSERFGIRVDFDAAGIETLSFASSDIETTAYRLAHLTNMLKHAQASTVSLLLDRHENWLQIIVEDDGVGFDPEALTVDRHFGLAGMRERLALVGGVLTIDSTIDTGTTLYFRIPLDSQNTVEKDVR
jgi:hypothetical protein